MEIKMKPINNIIADLGLNPNGDVQSFFTQTCANHMDKYVPYDNGGLAYDNKIIETDKIIYNSPYAHYMYVGKVMGPNVPITENGMVTGWFSPIKPKYYTGKDIVYNISAGHEHAGSYWDERMWTAEKNAVIKETQDYFNRRNS